MTDNPARVPDGPPIPISEFCVGPRQRGPEVVGGDGLTDSERAGQIPLWMGGGASQTRCALCQEPAHMVNGVLVHDFSGSEKCTYKSHL